MCGRYTLTSRDPAELETRFGIPFAPADALGRWNIAPTETMAVVTPGGPAAARWGLLPPYARDLDAKPQPINARAETVATHRAFAHARPCLVLADGWYEWLRAEDRRKVKPAPFRYTVDGGALFAFAGLTAVTRVGDGDVRSAAILTCPANAICARVHDRMPVVLSGPEDEAEWLASDHAEPRLCMPLSGERVTVAPVSGRVNRAGTGDEGPWLLEPDPQPDPEPEQASLF